MHLYVPTCRLAHVKNIKYFYQPEKRKSTRLPGVIISGVKKCGTKSLLRFLLSHPRLTGDYREYHYNLLMENFEVALGAFLGPMDHLSQLHAKTGWYLSTKYAKKNYYSLKTIY